MSSRHASKRQRKARRNARRLHLEHLESRIVLANATSFEFNDTDGLSLATPPALEDPIPEPIPDSSLDVKLTPVATGLTAPNWGAAAPGIDDRLFVADQTGELWSVNLETGGKSKVLDVGDRLVALGVAGPGTFDERGFLGFAFHPDFATNGLLYTYTSEPEAGPADFSAPDDVANHQSVIAEWQVVDPADADTVVDPASRREILRIDQPQFNHDAGSLNFGPDGLLYIPLGDGGRADDQGAGHAEGGNAQDPTNVLGSILRIDPLGDNSANGQYGIPQENPFVGNSDGIPEETFAFGLRNPFRASFDRQTGEFVIADVGQNDIEEVNRIDVAADAGGNFGWNLKEGTFFFNDNGAGRGFVTDVDPGGLPSDLIDPVLQYDHDEGIAVVGGFVYRGADHPELDGQYVFGDFTRGSGAGGRLFLGDLDTGGIEDLTPEGFSAFVLGFGQDAEGEVYLMSNQTGTPFADGDGNATGTVYRIDVFKQLQATGTASRDRIDIRQRGDSVELRLGGRVIEEVPAELVGSITVDSLGGDDSIRIRGVDVLRDVTIHSGEGANSIRVQDVDAGGGLQVTTGSGRDVVRMRDVTAGVELVIETGDGPDDVALFEIAVGANASILTGGSNDGVLLNGADFGGSLEVDSAEGSDRVTFWDVRVEQTVSIRTGEGNDRVTLLRSAFQDDVRIETGSGHDRLMMIDTLLGGEIEAFLGEDADQMFFLRNALRGPATADGGEGRDLLFSDESLLDETNFEAVLRL